jgi:hypothetical protein
VEPQVDLTEQYLHIYTRPYGTIHTHIYMPLRNNTYAFEQYMTLLTFLSCFIIILYPWTQGDQEKRQVQGWWCRPVAEILNSQCPGIFTI